MANGTAPTSLHVERKPLVVAEQEAGWVQLAAIRMITAPTGLKLHFFGRQVSSLISKPTELPVPHRAAWRCISTYPVQILVRMPTALRCFSYSA